MPEENGSDTPTGNPEGEALGQNPRSNLPEQRIVGKKSAEDPNQKEDDSEKPSGRVHWINYATFILSVILAVLTAGTIVVYYLQLKEMIHATNAAQDGAYAACMSAKIARSTLLELQSGEQDTHNAAAGTMLQASAAAQGQSGFLAMTMSRAFTFTSPDDSNPKNWKDLSNTVFNFSNLGRTSIRDLRIAFTVQVLPQDMEPKNMRNTKHLNTQRGGIIPPGTSSGAEPFITDKDGKIIHVDAIPMEDFRSGKIWVVNYGHAEFKDIFGTNHWQTFCGYWDTTSQVNQSHPKERHNQCADFNRQDSNLLFSMPKAETTHSISPVEEIVCTAPKH